MTTRTLYLALAAAAAAVAIGIIAGSLWSDHRIAKLEKTVTDSKQRAASVETEARNLEIKAAEYTQKIEYLEQSLSDIEAIARRQDEEIKQLSAFTDSARGGVRRARAIRSIESTTAELCARLAELGHACVE